MAEHAELFSKFEQLTHRLQEVEASLAARCDCVLKKAQEAKASGDPGSPIVRRLSSGQCNGSKAPLERSTSKSRLKRVGSVLGLNEVNAETDDSAESDLNGQDPIGPFEGVFVIYFSRGVDTESGSASLALQGLRELAEKHESVRVLEFSVPPVAPVMTDKLRPDTVSRDRAINTIRDLLLRRRDSVACVVVDFEPDEVHPALSEVYSSSSALSFSTLLPRAPSSSLLAGGTSLARSMPVTRSRTRRSTSTQDLKNHRRRTQQLPTNDIVSFMVLFKDIALLRGNGEDQVPVIVHCHAVQDVQRNRVWQRCFESGATEVLFSCANAHLKCDVVVSGVVETLAVSVPEARRRCAEEKMYIVGISGATGANKGAVTRVLRDSIRQSSDMLPDALRHGESVKHVPQDQYFSHHLMENRCFGNWDHPGVVKHISVLRDLCQIITVGQCRVIMADGFLLYHDPALMRFFDLKIFLEIDEFTCYYRRMLSSPVSERYFHTCIWPNHLRYIQLIKSLEDIAVVDGTLPPQEVNAAVFELLNERSPPRRSIGADHY